MGLFEKKEKTEDKTSQFRKIDENTYVDKETGEVISTYIPGRKARLFGRAILRQGKLRIFLLASVAVVILLFVLAFMQEKSGNFTINLDRLELFRKGISMSSDAYFTKPTAKLMASPIKDVTNIAAEDLPDDINDIDGDHNGRNYMAYTYYVRNAGKEPVDYTAVVTLDSASKGAEDAVRVEVWKNDKKTVYAMPAKDGNPEPGCENFASDELVCKYDAKDFDVGHVDKYTVVIWLDGDDPECVDAIVGGGLEFSMNLAAATEDDSSLLEKFVEDIKDTITGNRAISAAGTESPDYYKYQDVNWYTRKNTDNTDHDDAIEENQDGIADDINQDTASESQNQGKNGEKQ